MAQSAGVDGDLPAAREGHAPQHRADIDGLRAVSVLAVILFHIAPNRFPAGGLGVDLFFVISGYLIGGIVLSSTARNTFSFAEFYLRRLRRIAPAFIVMVVVVSVVAMRPLYPWEAEDFARSAVAALGCVSNIYFFWTSSYFAPDSASLPLLHTWSLGIEEQFYLFFPLLPLLFHRIGGARWLTGALIASAIASLAISQHQVATAPAAAFYLLPSRWWELMIGVIATRVPDDRLRSAALRLGLGSCGLLLIIASFVFVVPARGFPGLAALPACLGVALLLTGGRAGGSPMHRLLGLWPMRTVGLASYSLYLWHWPVIVLYRLDRVIGKLSIDDAVLVLTATAILGLASWRFVELPFRQPAMRTGPLLAWSGGLVGAALAVQIAILSANGFPARFPPRALALARYADPTARFPMPPFKCALQNDEPFTAYDGRRCLATVPGKPNWLLVGDSHAAMLWSGLSKELPEVHFQMATSLGCEIPLDPRPTGRQCDDLMHLALVEHVASAPPNAVVLTWRWQQVDEAGLARLVGRLRARGITLILLGPTAGYTVPVARVLAESVRRGDARFTTAALEPRLAGDDARLASIAARLGVPYLSPLRAMCQAGSGCTVTGVAGRPLYIDGDHYTAEGSATVIRRLRTGDDAGGQALRAALHRSR